MFYKHVQLGVENTDIGVSKSKKSSCRNLKNLLKFSDKVFVLPPLAYAQV